MLHAAATSYCCNSEKKRKAEKYAAWQEPSFSHSSAASHASFIRQYTATDKTLRQSYFFHDCWIAIFLAYCNCNFTSIILFYSSMFRSHNMNYLSVVVILECCPSLYACDQMLTNWKLDSIYKRINRFQRCLMTACKNFITPVSFFSLIFSFHSCSLWTRSEEIPRSRKLCGRHERLCKLDHTDSGVAVEQLWRDTHADSTSDQCQQ